LVHMSTGKRGDEKDVHVYRLIKKKKITGKQ